MCGSNETEGVPYPEPRRPVLEVRNRRRGAAHEVERAIRVDEPRRSSDWVYPKNRAKTAAAIWRSSWRPTTRRCGSRRMRLPSARRRRARRLSICTVQMAIAGQQRQAAIDARHGAAVRLRSRRQHALHERRRQGSLALAEAMSEAWVSFARTGNPNHQGLPEWPAFDNTRRATMMFDTECRAVNDPYGEERRAMQALR